MIYWIVMSLIAHWPTDLTSSKGATSLRLPLFPLSATILKVISVIPEVLAPSCPTTRKSHWAPLIPRLSHNRVHSLDSKKIIAGRTSVNIHVCVSGTSRWITLGLDSSRNGATETSKRQEHLFKREGSQMCKKSSLKARWLGLISDAAFRPCSEIDTAATTISQKARMSPLKQESIRMGYQLLSSNWSIQVKQEAVALST